jgi:ribosomal protein S18 acetylase RimI-like enzyme
MMPPGLAIRRATIADAAALAAFARRVFTDWYAPDNTPEDLALHIEHTYGTELQRAELASPDVTVLLVVDGESLCGYAMLKRGARIPVVEGPSPWAVVRFYVDRPWHGRGVAGTLMTAAAETARAGGARTLWLTAWEHNPRAQAFYAKAGFRDVGTDTFVLGHAPQVDRVLVLALD